MSFQEQERALFDLLFDRGLRESFCSRGVSALTAYQLDDSERNDFTEIRADALELDATMRSYLILTHICRAFPLSFCLVSSLAGGNNLIKSLIDAETMRTDPVQRSTVFGKRLREALVDFDFDRADEKNLIIAILEAELGMAWTAATLKQIVLESGSPEEKPAVLPDNWSSQAIGLAAYVSAAVIPQSHAQLKQSLCPCVDADLWKHLSRQPLTKAQRRKALENEDPKLFVARARVSKLSKCEPTIDHQTAELSEGFAHLFQYVNGTSNVDEILQQLKQAGANGQMLQGIRSGFQQLLENNMLALSNS